MNRVFGLDVIRAIAILIVLLGHSSFLLKKAGIDIIIPVDGVDIFFVLSGFLIGTILITLFDQKKVSISDLIEFWKRRWYRTLPLYFLMLLVNILLAFIFYPAQLNDFSWRFFFFYQNFNEPLQGMFFLESWSLCVEEWFYLMIPFFLISAYWLFNKLQPRSWIAMVLFFLLLTITFYRAKKAIDINVSYDWQWDIYFRKLVVMRLDSILFGVLAAYCKYYYSAIWQKWKYLFLIIGSIGICYLSVTKVVYDDFFYKSYYFTLLSIFLTCFLPVMDGFRKPLKVSKTVGIDKVITFFSLISYSLYLVHLPVLKSMENIFPEFMVKYPLLAFLIYWPIIIVVSYLSYNFFEKPMTALRDRKKIGNFTGVLRS